MPTTNIFVLNMDQSPVSQMDGTTGWTTSWIGAIVYILLILRYMPLNIVFSGTNSIGLAQY